MTTDAGMRPETLDPDPILQLQAWLDDAAARGVPLPEAFTLATADADGSPSARMVLLRGLRPDGLRFFGHGRSRKGRDLAVNPRAAAVFHWPALSRQVRVVGPVEQLPRDEVAAYFATRPRGHQLSAWASAQGRALARRELLERKVRELDRRFADGPVPLPRQWAGFILRPELIEFWISRQDRLHDRVEYRQRGSHWVRRRLQP